MKLRNLLLLLLLSSMWGPSFLFIKVGVREIPPLTLVAGRVGIGALLLYLILRYRGGRLPAFGSVWKHVAIVALFQNALPFVLLGWGEQFIDSALASVLNGTTPLFTIVLAHFFVPDDRLTMAKLTGVLLGFGGLVLLIFPSLVDGVQATTWGSLAVAGAAACYGLAIVYTRLHMRGLPPLVAPTAQLIAATAMVLPLSLLVDRSYALALPSWQALGSVLALGVLGTGLAFVVYYALLEHADASYVSMVTYVIPVFGVILGVLVLQEVLTWHTYVGCGLILFGVMLVNELIRPFPARPTMAKEQPLTPAD